MFTGGSAYPRELEQSTWGWEKRKAESDAALKTGWRSSIALKKVYSFGDKETMVEVLGLNSQNIMKGRSFNSVPPKCTSAI